MTEDMLTQLELQLRSRDDAKAARSAQAGKWQQGAIAATAS
jgi:hypothetical protein